MANARAPERQAVKAIRALEAYNSPRHANKDDGKIHSVGTARQYEQIFKNVAAWLDAKGYKTLNIITADQSNEYLAERSTDIAQKQLNNERRALELHLRHMQKNPGIKLDRIKSEVEIIQRSRAYTVDQVDLVQRTMTERTALSTQIALAAGLRASELLTLRRSEERSPSTHRTWSDKLYAGGREGWSRYTVKGKGGLVREVRLPTALANQLEGRRLDTPVAVKDRGVNHEKHYDLSGGNAFSAQFSTAAKKMLGWSEGAHGLRHTYAQRRIDELRDNGHHYPAALAIVSQELGHFRPEITEVYLR